MMKKLLTLSLVLMMGFSLLAILPGAQAETVDWVLEGQSPGERSSFVSAELPDGRIFVALGYNSSAAEHINDTWIFDPYEMTWTQMADSPVKTESSTGAYLNGMVYIFGGMLSNYSNMLTVLMYDIESDAWSTGTALPKLGTFSRCIAVDDERIMIVGGGDNNTEECFMFDTGSMSFTATASLPNGRSGGTLVMCSDDLFYFGGWDGGLTVQDEVFGYSIPYDYWWTSTNLPVALAGMAGVMGSDGLIYLLGGGESAIWYSGNEQTAMAWNLDQGNFIQLPDLDAPVRYAVATELDDGRIMYFNGHNFTEGNLGIFSLQAWEKEAWLTESSVDQGSSAWLHIRITANFATMEGIYGSVQLTQGNTTMGVYDIYSLGMNQLAMELPIPESLPAGDYMLEFYDMNLGQWAQEFSFEPLSLTVTAAPSTDEQLQDIMDQNQALQDQNQELMDENQALQDQLSALNDDLNDTRADLADVKTSADGKLDAMIGYVILIMVLVTLVVGVVILVRKK